MDIIVILFNYWKFARTQRRKVVEVRFYFYVIQMQNSCLSVIQYAQSCLLFVDNKHILQQKFHLLKLYFAKKILINENTVSTVVLHKCNVYVHDCKT